MIYIHLPWSFLMVFFTSEGIRAMRVAWNETTLPKKESFVRVYEAFLHAIQDLA